MTTDQKRQTRKKYYTQFAKIYVAVDCIIFGFLDNTLKILLRTRDFEPGLGKSSLIGGFVKEEESLDDAAARILHDLTGLENVFLEQLYTHGEIDRDPGERVISVSYYALLKVQDLDHDHVEQHGARWCNVGECNRLIFDHNEMVEKALARLRRRAKNQPIGFELLPRKFTIPQLQMLYEAIYQKKFDNRNFRKKLLAMDVLEKLEIKDKSTSKKGAYLYRFDKKRYNKLIQNGFLFDL
ncbi:MAG: DNA mismatch repair protein MutT [Bacteroides sp. SM23_62]|nr:MAG: DNA mismatch repair protein MutT [Bacteroides sp. SM23_62]